MSFCACHLLFCSRSHSKTRTIIEELHEERLRLSLQYESNFRLLSVLYWYLLFPGRLCGLVVRVSGYRYRGLGFDSRRYQIFLNSSGVWNGVYSASWASWGQLRRYLNKKSSGSRSRKQRLTAVGTRCADHVTPLYPQKLALTSPTGGGRSVGIARSRTKATEFSLVYAVNCPTDISSTHQKRMWPLSDYSRGPQIPGAKLPGPLNFIRWSLIFVGPQNGNCFAPRVLRWCLEFCKICVPLPHSFTFCRVMLLHESHRREFQDASTEVLWLWKYVDRAWVL